MRSMEGRVVEADAISDDELRAAVLDRIGRDLVHVRVETPDGYLTRPKIAIHATLGKSDGLLTIIVAGHPATEEDKW